MLVTGAAGMGKSAVVQALYEPLTARRGYFIAGKFEQFRRTPFSAVVAAFKALVTELLGESAERLNRLRNDLADALSPNGRLITDVIPQVELITGPQPPVEELGAAETVNRFDAVFRNFVRVFARPQHPVVLLLDDLQWADAASLNLMRGLLTDEHQSLLLLGAYRDNEVDANHPLTAMLARLAEDGGTLPGVALKPLSTDDVWQLIRDTTSASMVEAAGLADLVVRNTGGNPLFVQELLKTRADDGLMRFDRTAGKWTWDDLAEIRAKGFTESVLDLMVARLGRLDDGTRTTLQAAA
ncbi:MAG: AAA family ATPase [Proteobacteria bacterium]|nr:AAA family ATPase [Pseudomonadota bacterium]